MKAKKLLLFLIMNLYFTDSLTFAEYRKYEYYLPIEFSEKREGNITHIVLHFISNAVSNPNRPYDMNDIYEIFRENNVSTHYVIGRDGTVFMMVRENRIAFHAGQGRLPNFPAYTNRLNDYSIGIELLGIGTKTEMGKMMSSEYYSKISKHFIGFTDAQYHSLHELIEEILSRNPYILRDREHIIGHNEYAQGRKTDPGVLFDWSKIRLER